MATSPPLSTLLFCSSMKKWFAFLSLFGTGLPVVLRYPKCRKRKSPAETPPSTLQGCVTPVIPRIAAVPSRIGMGAVQTVCHVSGQGTAAH
ncbi:hypothetical protein AVEN_225153-1 [Araneus ventricosus]|uniref:Uncharacterized protein n=1 Tax=Araneus ventricosus TaxID=182803 RepID=A0A4Y2FSS1_ARAVE|nr:hypothetical protein AVEN_225153-1 [Araneus ventricosus]